MALYEDVLEGVEAFTLEAFTAVESAFGRPTHFEVRWDDFVFGPMFVGIGFSAQYAALDEPPESKRKLSLFCPSYLAMKRDAKQSLRFSTVPARMLSSPYAYRLRAPCFDALEAACAELRENFPADADFFSPDWNFDSSYEAISRCTLAIGTATRAAVKRLEKNKHFNGVKLVLRPHDNELVSLAHFTKQMREAISERRASLGKNPSKELLTAFVRLLSDAP